MSFLSRNHQMGRKVRTHFFFLHIFIFFLICNYLLSSNFPIFYRKTAIFRLYKSVRPNIFYHNFVTVIFDTTKKRCEVFYYKKMPIFFNLQSCVHFRHIPWIGEYIYTVEVITSEVPLISAMAIDGISIIVTSTVCIHKRRVRYHIHYDSW